MMNCLDINILNFVNRGLSNNLLNIFMPIISRIGGGEIYFMLGVLLLFSKKKELKILGMSVLAGLTFSYYIVTVLKVLVARPRPFMTLANIIMLGPMEKGYSFPSAHATQAFMMAILLSHHFKKYAFFYSFAAVIAFSRMYMGVHYPSDVLAGAGIGLLLGYILNRIAGKIE